MYGKLIDGSLRVAPPSLPGDGTIVYNPPAEMLEEAGYKLVVWTTPPECEPGYHADPYWKETEKRITQRWEIVENPDDIDEAEAFEILFGGGDE